MENLLSPRSVKQIFKDYEARRNAVLRALTQEVDYFYRLCDPEKDNLCLYGHADGRWEVNIPGDKVPPEFPEPILGINFARDGMNRSDWLQFVAKHTDSWLLAVAFFLGVRLTSKQRTRLFNLINDLPTIFQILNGEPTTGSGSTSYGRYNKKDKGKHSMENDEQVKSKAKLPPRSVEEIFNNYQARRSAILRALIQEVDDFYQQCDPEKENLCLFGNADGSWEVEFPGELPPELPEPVLGINFTRDSMNRRDWLISIAKYSDSWLLSVAFYFAAILNSNERKRLFNLISDLPTTFDILNTTVSVTLCGSCGRKYHTSDEFWIGCDICERWFHGECVKITPVRADSIQQYKCPSCSIRRGIIFHLTN